MRNLNSTIQMYFYIFVVLVTGCISPSSRWGIQDSYIGEVPAQIALLPCIVIQIPGQISDRSLCEKIDTFVEKSFGTQTSLRALSTRLVQKIADDHQIRIKSQDLFDYFQWPKREFRNSSSFLDRYAFHTQKKNKWLSSLLRLRLKSRFSDAVLLPLVLKNQHNIKNAQASNGEQKTAWVALLVDPLSGKVLWAQKATATVRGQEDLSKHQKELESQLLRQQFWWEFPGWSSD